MLHVSEFISKHRNNLFTRCVSLESCVKTILNHYSKDSKKTEHSNAVVKRVAEQLLDPNVSISKLSARASRDTQNLFNAINTRCLQEVEAAINNVYDTNKKLREEIFNIRVGILDALKYDEDNVNLAVDI